MYDNCYIKYTQNSRGECKRVLSASFFNNSLNLFPLTSQFFFLSSSFLLFSMGSSFLLCSMGSSFLLFSMGSSYLLL